LTKKFLSEVRTKKNQNRVALIGLSGLTDNPPAGVGIVDEASTTLAEAYYQDNFFLFQIP
jgi:hypothetical protein